MTTRQTVPDVPRRRFLQAAAAAVAVGSSTTAAAEDGHASASGYGMGGYGEGGYGGASPFSNPIGHAQSTPTDPDGDGRYEDVDGDGRVSVADVQTLLAFRSSQTVQDNAALLDFEGNDGDVDLADVRALFDEFTADIDSR